MSIGSSDIELYTIREVSEITGIKSNILRIWEKEFDFISPMKNKEGYRVYLESDIDKILFLKKLYSEDNLTIDDIRELISNYNRDDSCQRESSKDNIELLEKIKDRLYELKKSIKNRQDEIKH